MPNNTEPHSAVKECVSRVKRLQSTKADSCGARLPCCLISTWCRLPLLAFLLIIAFILSSCNSVPPGIPPEGPIVTPEIRLSVFDRKSAVNYMVTSIATRCTPISSAGINLPHIINEFTASAGVVNNMPIELWQSLIRMKMIVPAEENDSKKQYKLLSEIKEVKSTAEKKDYMWELKLVSLKDDTEVWKDSVEFVVMNEAPGP